MIIWLIFIWLILTLTENGKDSGCSMANPLLQNDLIVATMEMGSSPTALKMLSFCKNCESPSDGGSFVFGLIPLHLPPAITVTGKLIYSVPNHADSEVIYNGHNLYNNIALVERGKVSILEKCIRLQSYGAIGVVIMDDGRCNDDLTYCGPRAGGVGEGGFAPHDDPKLWKDINIPVFLISATSGDRLRRIMVLKRVEINGKGVHNVTMMRDHRTGRHEEL